MLFVEPYLLELYDLLDFFFFFSQKKKEDEKQTFLRNIRDVIHENVKKKKRNVGGIQKSLLQQCSEKVWNFLKIAWS